MINREEAPLVSVVVPTYQHAHFIGQCLESIVCQRSDFAFEILIGDDGSTDGTRELCSSYAMKYPARIRYFQREQSQRNPRHPPGRDNLLALLDAARGRYIARCDGDDYWTDKYKLQVQVDILEAQPELAGCFSFVQVYNETEGTFGRVYGQHGTQTKFDLVDTLTELAICHPSGFLFRRSALRTVPSWLFRVGSADMGMYSLTASCGPLLCIPKKMAVYRLHPEGITKSAQHTGSQHHVNRILLWLFMDRHFSYRFNNRVQELFLHHWKHICWASTPRQRLNYLWHLFKAVPQWYLTYPGFTLARLKEAVSA